MHRLWPWGLVSARGIARPATQAGDDPGVPREQARIVWIFQFRGAPFQSGVKCAQWRHIRRGERVGDRLAGCAVTRQHQLHRPHRRDQRDRRQFGDNRRVHALGAFCVGHHAAQGLVVNGEAYFVSEANRPASFSASPSAVRSARGLWLLYSAPRPRDCASGNRRTALAVPLVMGGLRARCMAWIGIPVVLLIVLLAVFWQWDRLIPTVNARASAALGRPVTMSHLHVRFGRIIQVAADDVIVANPPDWPKNDPPLASVGKLTVLVDVWSYLRGQGLILPLITLDKPQVYAAETPEGLANFHLSVRAGAAKIGTLRITGEAHVVIPKLGA